MLRKRLQHYEGVGKKETYGNRPCRWWISTGVDQDDGGHVFFSRGVAGSIADSAANRQLHRWYRLSQDAAGFAHRQIAQLVTVHADYFVIQLQSTVPAYIMRAFID